MRAHLAVMLLAATGATRAFGGEESDTDVQVRADSARREVVVTVGPIHIPEATHYSHHSSETRLRFRWPVLGWARGYRIELLDSAGRALPRQMLHHAGVVNLGRRQLAYPLVERLFSVGRETAPVMLPASMGVRMTPEEPMVFYYALVNTSASPVDGAVMRLSVAWTPEGTAAPREVFPLVLDANPKTPGGSRAFDVPPGVSITSAEFTLPVGGRLRALGGHLHDYAVEIRLEDVETGKRLARLTTRRDANGLLISVGSTRFILKRDGLRLAANRRYRVVGVYDNPTSATIPAGAMAFLAGPFIPDDVGRWPALDATDPILQRDLAGLLGEAAHAGHPHDVEGAGRSPR